METASETRRFSSVDEMLVCMGLFGIGLEIRRRKLMKPFANSRGRQRQRHMRRAYQKAMRAVGQHVGKPKLWEQVRWNAN